MDKRIIAIFTGNRAEYGLQYPILKAIAEHPKLDYRLIVSGAHLEDDFGRTIEEIRSDGFEIAAEVKIDLSRDSSVATSQAIGSGVTAISQALKKVNPNFLVVYADRFEGFAAVIAGTQMNIPTAHVEGGDVTEGGALDDSVRHAMTKLAHLHFTTNQQASNRVLAMGEEAWRVYTVGFPAIDLINAKNYASPENVSAKLGISLQKPIVIFTQHSITTQFDEADKQLKPSLDTIRRLSEEGIQVILTYPNNDTGSRQIVDSLRNFCNDNIVNIQLHRSLGRYIYHGILGLAHNPDVRIVCLGNSSSGIKETPAFGCPTVNIGSRQNGRLRGENVIDVPYDSTEIYAAVMRGLYDQNFRTQCKQGENPYGVGDVGNKIADCLATIPFDLGKLLTKSWVWHGLKRL